MIAPAGSTPRLRTAPRLRAGDRVRLVSPASTPSPEGVAATVAVLEGWGLVVEVGAHALDVWGYMAGTDEARLADLNDALRDPGVRAIVATRGGAGAYRIADALDFAAARADPKPLLGFSDITPLHLALLHHAGIASIHGCLFGARAIASCHRLLMDAGPVVLQRDPAAYSAAVTRAGRAEGPLIGGNLRGIAGCVGVRMPSLAGAILLLEDERKVGLGQVDRQLTQLIRSGALDGVAGVALGHFSGFAGYEDRGWTLLDVLEDQLGSLGIPVLGGLDIGHGGTGADGGPDQTCVALGAHAVLDAQAGTLVVESCMH